MVTPLSSKTKGDQTPLPRKMGYFYIGKKIQLNELMFSGFQINNSKTKPEAFNRYQDFAQKQKVQTFH